MGVRQKRELDEWAVTRGSRSSGDAGEATERETRVREMLSARGERQDLVALFDVSCGTNDN